jgi:hypothetical protein
MRRLFESKSWFDLEWQGGEHGLGSENRNLTEPEDIERALKLGEFIRDGEFGNTLPF